MWKKQETKKQSFVLKPRGIFLKISLKLLDMLSGSALKTVHYQ
jgi:hypothetical protein